MNSKNSQRQVAGDVVNQGLCLAPGEGTEAMLARWVASLVRDGDRGQETGFKLGIRPLSASTGIMGTWFRFGVAAKSVMST